MDRGLKGKTVAITGASSGIGQATAVACARAGAAVVLGARRKARIDALAEQIVAEGGQALAVEVDVSDETAARSFIDRAAKQFGGLNALINNAGVMLLGAVEGADTDDWRQMIEVNCLGLLYCTHAAMAPLRDSGSGHIVNISSVAGRHAAFGTAVYNMTKFGVTGFSEALRQEALNSNIRVTIVEPGFVDTELQGHNAKNEMVMKATEKYREEIGEVLTAEDIAGSILFALSQPQHVAINELLVRPTKQRR